MLPLQPRLRAVARWRKATYLRTNGKTCIPENCYVPEGKNLILPIHDYVQCTDYYFHVLFIKYNSHMQSYKLTDTESVSECSNNV